MFILNSFNAKGKYEQMFIDRKKSYFPTDRIVRRVSNPRDGNGVKRVATVRQHFQSGKVRRWTFPTITTTTTITATIGCRLKIQVTERSFDQ